LLLAAKKKLQAAAAGRSIGKAMVRVFMAPTYTPGRIKRQEKERGGSGGSQRYGLEMSSTATCGHRQIASGD